MIKLAERRLRHEYKYEINPLQYQVLKKRVQLLFKPDPFSGPEGGYNIRNLYFDNLSNSSLFEKCSGVYQRKKYRLRIYNCDDRKIKFERKAKIGEYILKEDVRVNREEADQMINGDFRFLVDSHNHLLKTAYLESRCSLLRAVVIVEYYREAFYDPVSHVRITFDSDLRASLGAISFFDSKVPMMRVIDEPNIIMEIKFGNFFPRHVQGLLPQNTQPRIAIGKYILCRAQQMSLYGCPIEGSPHAGTSGKLKLEKERLN